MPSAVRDTVRLVALCATALGLLCLPGCASWTNPVANGIPVRLLAPELLAQRKQHLESIPLASLRQKPPTAYRLAAGDMLGLYVEGVLGQEDQLPPVNFPDVANAAPSFGYPIVVREDGTLPLPLVPPVKVEGLTLAEAEQAVKRSYTEERQILLTGEERILVTLIRPRQTRVLVIRQDSPDGVDVRAVGFRGLRGGNVIPTGRPRGTGAVIDLPAYQNDVLTALAQTGGLPGSDAVNEVVIERGYVDLSAGRDAVAKQLEAIPPDYTPPKTAFDQASQIIRIPLRISPGAEPSFSPEDIILYDGDIVFIEAREAEFYYTGGLLPAIEVPLPRDYDLDVVQAITRVGGSILNGGIASNNLSGTTLSPGVGNPSPSLVTVLRRTSGGGQVSIRIDLNRALKDPRENILVQAGDLLILQETPGEAFARYVKDVFTFGLFSNVISRTDTTGTAELLVP